MHDNDEITTTARSKCVLRTLIFAMQVIAFQGLLEPSIYSEFDTPHLEYSRKSFKGFDGAGCGAHQVMFLLHKLTDKS